MVKIKKLNEIIGSEDVFARGLINNGLCHQNYKIYTSMEKGLQFLLTGELYFSDGSNWNDKLDRIQMKDKNAFALCTSFSTKENVAMWMLYSDKKGANGVALNLTKNIIKRIVNANEAYICRVSSGDKDEVLDTVSNKEFNIFCTDVVYTSEIKNNPQKVKINCNGDNKTINKKWLESKLVFSKKYEWKYENETRVVILPTDELLEKIECQRRCIEKVNQSENRHDYLVIKIKVPQFKQIKEYRLIRSPVYEGKVSFGSNSALHKEIEW